jgi:hypothetical protein
MTHHIQFAGFRYPACFLAVLCSLLTLPAGGQEITGIISGTVTDPSDAVVPGATVKLTLDATGESKSVSTEANGTFAFLDVFPGQYTVSISAKGFKGLERKNINLTSSERMALGRIALDIGAATESVTVVSQGAAVQTESSERSAVITAAQVRDLSSLTRAWTTYMLTIPSVYADGGDGSSPSIAGQPASSNTIVMDGIGGDGENGGPRFRANLDEIAELHVIETNPPAEYGNHPGAIIDIVTKSGTKDFHGSGCFYIRNEALNANAFFNNRVGTARPISRYDDYCGSVGGPIFIPHKLSRNKLFFFVSEENQVNNAPSGNRDYTMPTQLERNGDFSQSLTVGNALIPIIDPTTHAPFPGNVVPANRIDPVMQKYISLFPLPNFATPADRLIANGNYNYIFSETQPNPYNKLLGKIDWVVNEKLHVMVEDSYWRQVTGGYSVGAGFAAWGEIQGGYARGSHGDPTGRITYTINPTMTNEFLWGGHYYYEGTSNENQAQLDKFNRVKAGINIPYLYPANANASPYDLIPVATFGGVTDAAAFSMDSRFPLQTINRKYGLSDNLTKTWKGHTFKAGIFWDDTDRNYGNFGTYYGSFDFQNNTNNPLNTGYAYSNAILGNFYSYTEASNRFEWKVQGYGLEWYAQDTWKVTRKLTLNYGLRLSYMSLRAADGPLPGSVFNPGFYNPAQAVTLYQPTLVNGVRMALNPLTGQTANAIQIGAIVPNSGNLTDGMALDSNPKVPRGDMYDPGLLPGPRFGFAYDPFGNGKTAIRGGFGIMYEIDKTNADLQPANPPAQYNPVVYYGNIASINAGSSGASLFPPTVTGRSFTGHVPTSYSGSFGVQRQLGWGTVLDIAYVGVLGRHILAELPLNNLPYGVRFLTSSLDPTNGKPLPDNFLRPIAGYGPITQYEYSGSSNYHSMQTQINRRFAKGILFGATWTWSKAMDYGGEYGTYAQYASRRVWNYGESSTDRTHIVSINWLWELPKVDSLTQTPVVRTALNGWRLSGIATFISGAPAGFSFSNTAGADLIGGGDGQRVNVTCNPELPKSKQTFNQYFNTGCIAEPAVGYIGDADRTAFYGPGVNNWNMSFFRTFKLKERATLEFRAETYNTFNHTQFSGVNASAQFNAAGQQVNSQFGQVTSAASARFIQLAVRISF